MGKWLAPAGAIAAITIGFLIPACAQASPILDSATYGLMYMGSSRYDSMNSALPADGIAVLSESYTDNSFQATANMSANGYPSPTADLNVEIDNNAPAGTLVSGYGAYASVFVTYEMSIVQTADLPDGVSVSFIPVFINSVGEVSALAGGTGQTSAQVSVLSSALGLNLVANASCNPTICPSQPAGFDSTLLADVALNGQPISITVGASGNAFVGGDPGYSSFQGIADPIFTIDPSYQYADDFSVIISPNVGNTLAAVPEPATWATMLVGLGGIGFMMRNSRRKGAVAAT